MADNLTKAEYETNVITMEHIEKVREFITIITDLLRDRGVNHDKSKLSRPEVQFFTEHTPKLSGLTFGSKEYNDILNNGLKPAVDNHYAKNRHHPQHFPKGIEGMNLIDIVEMLCDWKASSLRHDDGNILKSIDYNAKKFGFSDQLVKIFKNTVEIFDHL